MSMSGWFQSYGEITVNSLTISHQVTPYNDKHKIIIDRMITTEKVEVSW